MNKGFASKLKKLFEGSFFIGIFLWLADFFYNKICHSQTAKLLTCYDKVQETCEESLGRKLFSKLWFKSDKRLLAKNSIQTVIENSFLYKSYLRINSCLLGFKVRIYGMVLFIYGFFAVSVGLIKTYVSPSADNDFFLIYQGLALIVASIPLLISRGELGVLLANGVITGFITNKIMDVKEQKLIREPIEGNMVITMLVGMLFGASSLIVDPVYVLLGFAALVYVSFVFFKPEFGIIAATVSIPFLPTMLLCGQILLVFTAFMTKVLRGKRSVKFGVVDIAVLVFAVFVFLGGVLSASVSTSLPAVCVMLSFMLAYFLIVNLIKTTQMLERLIVLLSCSVLVCACIGIWQNFFGVANTTWTDVDMFSDIQTRVISTFENPNVFGEYLIMYLPMLIALWIIEKSFKKKYFFAMVLVAGCAALVFTWSRGAWLGFLLSVAIYLIAVNKKVISLYFIGLFSLPFLVPFLPSTIVERFSSIGNTSDSSTAYRVHIWEASWDMIKDKWLGGIGVGTGAFTEVYPSYSLSGIETAPHSHNLYFQVLLELGIFGFIALLAALILSVIKCTSYMKTGNQKKVKLISFAAITGVLAILVQGITDHVWYNYRIFLIFWTMLAISTATVNIAQSREVKITQDDNNLSVSGGKNEKAEISIQI